MFKEISPLWEESKQLFDPRRQAVRSDLVEAARGMMLSEADRWVQQLSPAGLEEGKRELAMARGLAVAVDYDGPEVAGLEEALKITRDYLDLFV